MRSENNSSETFLYSLVQGAKTYLIISARGLCDSVMFNLRLLLPALHYRRTYGFPVLLQKHRDCMKNHFSGLHWGSYMVLNMLKLLYIARAQMWIIYSVLTSYSYKNKRSAWGSHARHARDLTENLISIGFPVAFCLQVGKTTPEGRSCINSQRTDKHAS